MVPTHLLPEPEYALLLDAIAPLEAPRTDHRAWDPGRWGQLLNAADWHRASPALFTHLRGLDRVPAPVLTALERAYFANAAHSALIRETTARVTGTLEASGIRAILLKGAALIETVYDDPVQREMLDIDVLVPNKQLDAATAALSRLGYLPNPDSEPEPRHTGRSAIGEVPHHGAALVGPDRLMAVELHRHIAVSGVERNFDLSGLWERARTVRKTNHEVPSPEDLLIHVCFHFTRNRLGGNAHRRNTGGALAQIMDIQRLTANEAIDWPALARTAHEFGLGKRVYLGLFAASELGVPIAAEAIEPIRPKGFNAELGRRLVELRVLRAGDHLPVRSMRWMFAPSREALRRGWNADPNATLSLARAYMRRAKAHVPETRSAMRRPWVYLQDRRLNGQIEALREHA
jgi:Uncharacterised nucleotidyltransferase